MFAVSTDNGVGFRAETLDSGSFGYPTDIVAGAGRWIAVGSATPPGSRWGPGIWTSGDTITWSEVALDRWEGQRFALTSIAVNDGLYVAAARRENKDRIVVLRSTDGTTWKRTNLDSPLNPGVHVIPNFTGLSINNGVHVVPAQDGFELLNLGHGGLESIDSRLRSLDGAVWTPVEPVPAVFGDGSLHLSKVEHNAGITVAAGLSMHRSNVLHCYDDVATCQHRFSGVWVSNGDEWWRLDLSGFDLARLVTAATVGDATIVVDVVDHRVRVWTWEPNNGVATPPQAAPLDTSPPLTHLELPERGEPLRIGVRYAKPQGNACGNFSSLGKLNGV